jgi:23S rRNA pseudouridine2605 synthase
MERKNRQGKDKPEEHRKESGKFSKSPARKGSGRSSSRENRSEGGYRKASDSESFSDKPVRKRRVDESSDFKPGRSNNPVRKRTEDGRFAKESEKPLRTGRSPRSTNDQEGFSQNSKPPYRQKSPGRLRRESGYYSKGPETPERDDKPQRFKRDEDSPVERKGRTFRDDKPGNPRYQDSDREDRPKRYKSDESRPVERKGRTYSDNKPGKARFQEKSRDDKFKRPYNKDNSSSPRRRSSDSSSRDSGLIRLNRFIANSGICSRREADQYIQAGAIKVNGKVVTELGTKVSPTDRVQYDDQTIRSERLVYLLLNKPKGFITTTDDPYDRKTVMALVQNACTERIYPVGRLDRNTTGLLLLTNDGDMAKKLTHPKHNVRKVYHVELDKALAKNDMMKIVEGIELEDGVAMIDEIAYAEGGKNKKEVGVELHSGKNRIVRRIFESLGYEVVKLDRMIFAGLTKKDVPRGKWRFLSDQEVNYLKMLK